MVIIVNLGSKKTPEIAREFSQLGIANKIVNEADINLDEINASQALVLSGSPVLLSEIPGKEYNDYLIRFEFIKNLQIPVLGICFGHQLLGILHGGRIGKCTPDRDWQVIKQVNANPMFNSFGAEFKMKEDHQEQVTVPPYFIHLASSEICENEAMAHPSKKMVSVQFHPEVSESNGNQFFANIVSYFGLN